VGTSAPVLHCPHHIHTLTLTHFHAAVRVAAIVPSLCSFSVFQEIDQVFSRVGVALRATDAATRTILGKHIVGSYKKNVSSFSVLLTHLYNCGNVRDLLQGKMFSIPSVTKPQAFRIARDPSDNNVKLQVQSRGYEDKWSAIDRYVEQSCYLGLFGTFCRSCFCSSFFLWGLV